MGFPPGIVAKTVTIGTAAFFDGTIAEGTVTITAPVNVIHTPSNRPLFSSQMSQRFIDGEASFNLVPTDHPDLNRRDFSYRLNVVIQGALVQPDPIHFLLPMDGPDIVDLDGLVTVPSSAGTPVAVDVLTTVDLPVHVDNYLTENPPAATGPAGGALSGSYPDPGLNESAVESVVAGRVADDTSDTSAALGTAIDSATHPLGVAARGAYGLTQSVYVAASRALQLTDVNKCLDADNASTPIVITVPTNAEVPFPIGTTIQVHWYGVAPVTVAPAPGNFLIAEGGHVSPRARFTTVELRKLDANAWSVAGQTAAAAGVDTAQLDAIEDSVAQVQATAVISEDLAQSVVLDTGAVLAARTQAALAALAACTVDQATLSVGTAVAASDTAYWTVELVRYRAGVPAAIATKTTKTASSGGEGMGAFVGWTFDLVTFGGAQSLAKGDVLAVRMTPTGAPPALDGPTLTFRAQPSDGGADTTVVVLADTFDRADGTSLGATSTGGVPWQVLSGTWGIIGGQMYSPASTSNEKAVVETGYADCTVDLRIAALAAGGSAGHYLRATDAANGFQLAPTQFYRTEGGALVALAGAQLQQAGSTFVAGDTARVKMSGPNFTIYRDAGSTGTFVQVATCTDAFNQTATKHGVRMSGNTGNANRVDNFVVTTP